MDERLWHLRNGPAPHLDADLHAENSAPRAFFSASPVRRGMLPMDQVAGTPLELMRREVAAR
jgi:hypothetical protein